MTYYNYFILTLLAIFDLYLFYSIYSSRGGKYPPFVPAPKHSQEIIFQYLGKVLATAEDTLHIVDAGCGTGTLIQPLAIKYPKHRFTGIEWNGMLYKICLWRRKNLTNLYYLCQDMLAYDYSQADIIICFIIPQLVPNLQKCIADTARPGTLICSIDCRFPDLTEICSFKSKLFWTQFNIYCYHL